MCHRVFGFNLIITFFKLFFLHFSSRLCCSALTAVLILQNVGTYSKSEWNVNYVRGLYMYFS